MWMAVVIGGGLFVALFAMMWLNVEDREREREKSGAGAPERCRICDGPLPGRRASDDVLREVEDRIQVELAAISRRAGSVTAGAARPHAHPAPGGRAGERPPGGAAGWASNGRG